MSAAHTCERERVRLAAREQAHREFLGVTFLRPPHPARLPDRRAGLPVLVAFVVWEVLRWSVWLLAVLALLLAASLVALVRRVRNAPAARRARRVAEAQAWAAWALGEGMPWAADVWRQIAEETAR